jgi:hypothetical protein
MCRGTLAGHDVVWVCTGPGLVAKVMFGSGPFSGLIKILAMQSCIEHFRLSWTIRFSQIKFIVVLILSS